MSTETEAKWRLVDAAASGALREQLVSVGGVAAGMTAHEANLLFDDARDSLRASNQVLRLRIRDHSPEGTLTYKGPASADGGLKSRTEIESVCDAHAMITILGQLGYRIETHYDKRRETYRLLSTEVALDTLNERDATIGYFCEIEGPPDAVRSAAAALGLDLAAAESRSYPELVEEWRHQR